MSLYQELQSTTISISINNLFIIIDEIEKIYKKFNYPSNVQKLLKLVKAQGITATSNDI